MTTAPAVLARAPGKLILAGEHAAVRGGPVLAAALGLHCTAVVRPRGDGAVELLLPDVGVRRTTDWQTLGAYTAQARRRWSAFAAAPGGPAFAVVRGDDPAHVVAATLGETLPHLRRAPSGITLTVRSRIPVGAGFGSSAATAVATCAAVLAHHHGAPDPETVAAVAARTERLQHGTPSGIDTATVQHGGTRWLPPGTHRTGRAARPPIDETALGMFELHHTGPAGEPTGQVVVAVHDRLTPQALAQAEQATTALRTALACPRPARSEVIAAIRDSARFLTRLTVVPEPVATVIRTVEEHGGAAKICGAGSLTGPGAGALLVVRPDGGRATDLGLDRFTPVAAPLGVAGLHWEEL
ncbi:mevalonate kinase [Streptomyces sp. NPDC056169]|uniref:mevalonate kinase family protein n=1 Tax=Streptomyces sp. NPDC056169 TaxID=3345734 RepID=UPI0035D6D807